MHIYIYNLNLYIVTMYTYSPYIYVYYITVFGPPKVTLKCSADYVTLSKVVGVSWLPTLLSNQTSISTQAVNNRVQNCEAGITCSGGYNKPPVSSTARTFYTLHCVMIIDWMYLQQNYWLIFTEMGVSSSFS